MGLIREPKNVDFTVQSKPWTEEELRDFRKLMNELKEKNRSVGKAILAKKTRAKKNQKKKKELT